MAPGRLTGSWGLRGNRSGATEIFAAPDRGLAIGPDRTLAEVETEVSAAFAVLGMAERLRRHTGHGIGLEGHEWPFIDKGSDDVIEEMMVLTIERGIYVSGLEGLRHSDTVVVRAGGGERLTYYPRDLQSLIVGV